MSGGQAQRIAIARALYENKSLLVLDESTNSLDLNTEIRILKGLLSEFNMNCKVLLVELIISYTHPSIRKTRNKQKKNKNERYEGD